MFGEECFEGRSAISPSRRSVAPGLTCRDASCCRIVSVCAVPFHPGLPDHRVSLDDLDPDGFRGIAREALDQFSHRKVDEAEWAAFSATLNYVPLSPAPAPEGGGRGGRALLSVRPVACTI